MEPQLNDSIHFPRGFPKVPRLQLFDPNPIHRLALGKTIMGDSVVENLILDFLEWLAKRDVADGPEVL
jgi:hypothetical protein